MRGGDAPAKMAAAFLEAEAAANAALAEPYKALAELHERKLWHQLTVKLEEVVGLPAAQTGTTLVRLYQNFISDFEHKINLLKLAQLAVAASGQFASRAEAVGFLDGVVAKLVESKEKRSAEPVLYVRMHVAVLQLHDGNAGACKALVEEGKTDLDGLIEPEPAVSASVHFAAAQLAKFKQDFAEFYRSAILYLSYTQVDALPAATKLELAVDLSLAGLLGENVYNFGELLAHPAVQCMVGSPFEWLFRVLEVFHAGDLHKYDELCNAYADQLNAQPALVANERKLREKITILALMEIIFQLPADDRTISLETIAQKTKLPLDGVEFLLMKTLSVHLIEGIIDQVEGTVRVSWVQPRVLLTPQIAELRSRLDGWIEKVHTALVTMEGESPDLVGVAA